MFVRVPRPLVAVAGLLLSGPLLAQTLPDAGRVLQEMAPLPQPERSDTEFSIESMPLEGAGTNFPSRPLRI